MENINITLLSYINNTVFYNTLNKFKKPYYYETKEQIYNTKQKIKKYVKKNIYKDGNFKVLYKFINKNYITEISWYEDFVVELFKLLDDDEKILNVVDKDGVFVFLYFLKMVDFDTCDMIMTNLSYKHILNDYILFRYIDVLTDYLEEYFDEYIEDFDENVYKEYFVSFTEKFFKKYNEYINNNNINYKTYKNIKELIQLYYYRINKNYLYYKYLKEDFEILTKNVKDSYIRFTTKKILEENFKNSPYS